MSHYDDLCIVAREVHGSLQFEYRPANEPGECYDLGVLNLPPAGRVTEQFRREMHVLLNETFQLGREQGLRECADDDDDAV